MSAESARVRAMYDLVGRFCGRTAAQIDEGESSFDVTLQNLYYARVSLLFPQTAAQWLALACLSGTLDRLCDARLELFYDDYDERAVPFGHALLRELERGRR